MKKIIVVLVSKLNDDPHYSLKNKVFYRQDYLDEFEAIWEKQAQYHKELTNELKKEIRDIVIFYHPRDYHGRSERKERFCNLVICLKIGVLLCKRQFSLFHHIIHNF